MLQNFQDQFSMNFKWIQCLHRALLLSIQISKYICVPSLRGSGVNFAPASVILRLAKLMISSHISVLVVEEDLFQRFTLVEILSNSGFNVLEAHDSAEALEQLRDIVGIDAIVTDAKMPSDGMNGLEFAAVVHVRWPNVRIIVASGEPGIKIEEIPAKAQLFSKPYNSQNIAIRLREMVLGDRFKLLSPEAA